jgi:hypothetical protein
MKTHAKKKRQTPAPEAGAAGFSFVRKAIADYDRAALVGLIRDLHSLSEENRAFLDARFRPANDTKSLEHYKKIVSEALYVDLPFEDRDISFRDARKALSDYRKAIGRETGLAELLVLGAEKGTRFTLDYGNIDEPFYDSLERMFHDAVTHVAAMDPSVAEPWRERLKIVVNKARNMGWGFYDTIASSYDEAWPEG